jgi:hypothetical protein
MPQFNASRFYPQIQEMEKAGKGILPPAEEDNDVLIAV